MLLDPSGDADHMKFLISLSRERQVLLGMGITIEMWRGIEERTCLIKVSLPAKERHLSFQPESLTLKESSILWKNLCLGLPKKIRTPR